MKFPLLLITFAYVIITNIQALVTNVNRANFKCDDGEVIPSTQFCDGTIDCSDGSDEITNENSITNRTLKYERCTNIGKSGDYTCFLQLQEFCRDIVRCKNFTTCDADCVDWYYCQKTGQCMSRSTICDKNACNGCPEDHEWTNGVGFKCRRNGKECILPQQLVWDGVADCDGGTDLCITPGKSPPKITGDFRQLNTSSLKTSKCFQCLQSATFIPKESLCDGIIDCPDLSDECLCESSTLHICNKVVSTKLSSTSSCKAGEINCKNGSCIPRSSICDGKVQCSQAEDEDISFCGGTKPCMNSIAEDIMCRCHTWEVNRNECNNVIATACNEIEECKLPPRSQWNRSPGYPEDECEAKCETAKNFGCTFMAWSSVGEPLSFMQCFNSTLGTTPRQTIIISQDQICDGYKDCSENVDEANCPNRFICFANNGALTNIDKKKVCDGFIDCDSGEDETKDLCGKSRFFCPSLGGRKVNIENNLVCDTRIACDNQDDERNCTDDGRFYCENEKPLFVIKRKIFDGRLDCSDWSDECPTMHSRADILNSRYEMIGSVFLRVLVWFMGLLAFSGNAIIIITVSNKQRKEYNKNIDANMLANRLLILNLAVADFLMGIYLIGLGIAGLTMQGRYCAEDLNWRSGSACVALGVLSVLSSETSVVTMVLLTASRLYAVRYPLSSPTHPKLYVILLGISAAWIFSFFIAFLPLSTSLQRHFIYQASFNDNPFAGKLTMDLGNARNLAERALNFDLGFNASVPGVNQAFGDIPTASWSDLALIFSKYTSHPEYYKATAHFGYYSIDSVCIPKFFVTTSDRSWGFSFTVTLFNFLAFIFVAASYGFIYYKSLSKKFIRQSDNSAANKRMRSIQRKILRLIITDFCCWMPICITAFCKISGAYVGDTAYAVAAIVLLPINSALNPILYSDIPEKIYGYFSKRREERQSLSHDQHTDRSTQETNPTSTKRTK